jgi:hypothetical protein
MTNCTQTGSTSYGFYLHDSVTGVFTGDGLTATGNANIDYYFKNLTLDAGSTLRNSTATNSSYIKIDRTSNLALENFVSDGAYATNPAIYISNGASNILLKSCEVKNGGSDAYYIYDSVGVSHDITFIDCVAHDGGSKTNGGNGDGFTAHGEAYNINIYYSKAYNMTGTAVAMVGNSAGTINNFTSYNNGGNWTSEGGVETTRAGTYIATSGFNPTTGTGWTIKNMISKDNYPREIYLTATSKGLVDIDFNLYNETTSSQFATIDGGNSNITWETYHATYEEHSLNSDPLFISATNYHLQSGSPARGAGVDVGLSNTNPPDIGAEPYQQYVPWR